MSLYEILTTLAVMHWPKDTIELLISEHHIFIGQLRLEHASTGHFLFLVSSCR